MIQFLFFYTCVLLNYMEHTRFAEVCASQEANIALNKKLYLRSLSSLGLDKCLRYMYTNVKWN